jgi:hypothetical protein
MTGWLKAGLIGAGIVVGLKVLQLVPGVSCCAIPGQWVVYGCVGALAVYWVSPVRTVAAGAGRGALAGLIAAAIGGVIGIGVDFVGSMLMAPVYESLLRYVPPEVFRWMLEAGFDPRVLTAPRLATVGTITGGTVCCGAGLVIGVALGALGGVVFAVVKPQKEAA